MRRFLLLFALIAAPACAQNSAVATLMDPAQHLASARTAFGSGQTEEGTHHLQVALEEAPIGSAAWREAYQLAMERRSDLFARALVGTNFPVPLAVLPEDDVMYTPEETFAIPPIGPLEAFLDRGTRETFDFRIQNGQWQDAAHAVEEMLDRQRSNIPGLLLVANLYERKEQLALAFSRYTEVADKARLTDEESYFTALFGIFRTQYRRQDFHAAEQTLARYQQAAQLHLNDVLEQFRNSPRGRSELSITVLEGRRHLVEAFNTLGVIKAFRHADREAAFHFEQARLLAPGALPVALNQLELQVRAGYLTTARNQYAELAAGLSALEQALMAQLDRSIDAGVLDLGVPLTFRELLRQQIARVRVRQGLLEIAGGQPRVAEGFLTQAASLADTSAIAHYFVGRDRQQADRLDEAVAHYKKAMTVGAPGTRLVREARKRIDEVFELQGLRAQQTRTRDDQLREHFEEKIDPAQMQILRRELADCVEMMQHSEFEKARAHLARLAEYHKDSLEIYRYLAYANQELVRYKEALIAYDQALAIDKADPWAMSGKAICLYEYLNDLPNALELAEKAARVKGDDPIILSNLGWMLVMSNAMDRGTDLIKQAIALSPKDPRHHMRLAMAYYNVSLWTFAETKFRDVLGLDPKHPKATVFLGITLARMGRAAQAIDQLSASVEIVKGDPGLSDLVVKNLALLKGGTAPSGAPGPKGADDPKLPLTHDMIARAAEANGRLTAARDAVLRGELATARVVLEAAYRDYPANADIAFCHAFLAMQAGGAEDLKLARTVLGGMLDVNTQEVRAYHALAHVAFTEGKVQEMVDLLARIHGTPDGLAFSEFLEALAKRWQQVLDLDHGDQKAIAELGLVLLLEGRLAQARDVLSHATTPAGKQEYAEALLRIFEREHRQLDFQQAKEAAQQGGYAAADKLDLLWNAVTQPKIAAIEQVVTNDIRDVPAKEFEGWWRFSDAIKKAAFDATDAVGRMDISQTPIPTNRRWSQIDQSRRRKQEALEAARNHERAAKERDRRDKEERARQERIRKGLASPGGRPPPGRPGGPQPLGAVVLADDDEAPKNQLHDIAAKQLSAGLDKVRAGRLAEAAQEFRGAISLDPNNQEAHLSLAMALVVSRDTAHARPVIAAEQAHFGPGTTALALAGHAAWIDGDVQGAARAWARIPAAREQEKAARHPRAARGRAARAKPGPPPPRYLAISRQAWASTLADAPSDLDANLALAQLDLFAGDAHAAIKRLEPLTSSLEGASAFAEACLFAAACGDGEKLVRRGIQALAEIEGADSFALQKRLRTLLSPKQMAAR